MEEETCRTFITGFYQRFSELLKYQNVIIIVFLPLSTWGVSALKTSGPISLIFFDSRDPGLGPGDGPALGPVLF